MTAHASSSPRWAKCAPAPRPTATSTSPREPAGTAASESSGSSGWSPVSHSETAAEPIRPTSVSVRRAATACWSTASASAAPMCSSRWEKSSRLASSVGALGAHDGRPPEVEAGILGVEERPSLDAHLLDALGERRRRGDLHVRIGQPAQQLDALAGVGGGALGLDVAALGDLERGERLSQERVDVVEAVEAADVERRAPGTEVDAHEVEHRQLLDERPSSQLIGGLQPALTRGGHVRGEDRRVGGLEVAAGHGEADRTASSGSCTSFEPRRSPTVARRGDGEQGGIERQTQLRRVRAGVERAPPGAGGLPAAQLRTASRGLGRRITNTRLLTAMTPEEIFS